MILEHVDCARGEGARLAEAAAAIGLDPRTLERWRAQVEEGDRRAGPRTEPGNKLSDAERREVLETANSPEFRDMSPNTIVPILAERDCYVASERTFYRVLGQQGQLQHRSECRPPTKRSKPPELKATGPGQVWSWDITYLPSPVRGMFWYLYMALDVWTRRVVAATVYTEENAENAAEFLAEACRVEGIERGSLSIHMDNGSPMKGSTLRSTLDRLNVRSTFSRPRVSNDNPYSESLFCTVKSRPSYPPSYFDSCEGAQRWVDDFVEWYNHHHRHSSVRYVTPQERHDGQEKATLARRNRTYARAQARRPERWSGRTRNWTPVTEVKLNSDTQVA